MAAMNKHIVNKHMHWNLYVQYIITWYMIIFYCMYLENKLSTIRGHYEISLEIIFILVYNLHNHVSISVNLLKQTYISCDFGHICMYHSADSPCLVTAISILAGIK